MGFAEIGLGIFGLLLAIMGIVQVWRPHDVIAFRKRFPVTSKLDLTFFVWDSPFAIPIVRWFGVLFILFAALMLSSYVGGY